MSNLFDRCFDMLASSMRGANKEGSMSEDSWGDNWKDIRLDHLADEADRLEEEVDRLRTVNAELEKALRNYEVSHKATVRRPDLPECPCDYCEEARRLLPSESNV